MTKEELQEAIELKRLEREYANLTGVLPTLYFDKKPKTDEEPTLSPQAQMQLEAKKKAIEQIREEDLLKKMEKDFIMGPSSDYKQNPLVNDPLEMQLGPRRELSSEKDSDVDSVLLDQLVSEVSGGNLDGPIQKEILNYKSKDPERFKRLLNLRKQAYPKGIPSE